MLTGPVDDPAAWRGDTLARAVDWQAVVPEHEVAELDACVRALKGRSYLELTRDDFPVRALLSTCKAILDTMEQGRGFMLLRGLPVARWGEEGTRIALWGLGTHLGWAEPQDGAGNRMHDVRDIGQTFGSNDTIRYFQTNQAIEFHNDGADIFALLCLSCGREGGRSRLLSAVEVFNELARRRPELAQALQEDFHFDARGQHPDGARCQVHPVYTHHAGKLNVLLKTAYIHSAQRFPDVPPLTERQSDALGELNALLEEDGMALEFDPRPGDMLVASNHVVLHGRTAYSDAPGPQGPSRHMLRLWLTIPNGRPLPPHYAQTREFGPTYARRMT